MIRQEQQTDEWFLLHTNQSVAACPGPQVLAQYQGLLQVEEAFGKLKSYLEVRPVFRWRPDRVINHVWLCFLAYWLSARLGQELRGRGETEEVPRLLRQLQTIRLGTLKLGQQLIGSRMTEVPAGLNAQLTKPGLAELFAAPPAEGGG